MEIFIPKEVSFLIDTIYENGYEAFMVGGCVRDSILNLTPNDYDITTSATPQEIMNIFKDYKIIDTGIKHGTVSIILNNNILLLFSNTIFHYSYFIEMHLFRFC